MSKYELPLDATVAFTCSKPSEQEDNKKQYDSATTMTCSVRILSTTSVDSSPAILLVAPNGDKTLVNCGEGCQRIFLEFGQKLSTVHRVCLTHLSHSTLGGLPGMVLTSADVATNSAVAIAKHRAAAQNNNHQNGQASHKRPVPPNEDDRPGLDIIGPIGLEAFVHSLRHFMRREAFDLRLHQGEYYQRQQAKPSAKRRKPPISNNNEDFHVQSIACGGPNNQQQALSYIFTTPPVPGKFLAAKANQLGIPRGPLYGQLKAGKSITFTDPKTGEQRQVTSHEVVEPGSPGVAVAVLYYPNLGIWETLQGSEPLTKLLPPQNNDAHQPDIDQPQLEVLVHLTSKSCFESVQCSEWRERLGPNMQHIFLATDLPQSLDEDPGTPFHSTNAGATCRAELSNASFISPQKPVSNIQSCSLSAASDSTPTNVVQAVPLLEYTIIPRSKRGFSNHFTHEEHRNVVNQQMQSLLETSGAMDMARQAVPHDSNGSSASDGELIFTGTGSAIPCKHRNVSGIYLQMANHNAILLDVGEGTVGQLLRAKHQEDHKEVLRRIRAVWISHPHADHHLGILRLLSERQSLLEGQEKPVMVIAPTNLIHFLKEYESVDPHVAGSYVVLDCRDISNQPLTSFSLEKQPHNQKILQRLRLELGITGVQSIPVQHCAHSYAVEIRGTTFGNIAYSGDCRPSGAFAEAALHADVLIHEATFTDGMEAEAALKRHSTVGEALEVASMMKAKNVVLTHFSQRFPKIPPVSSTNTTSFTTSEIPVIFAFDYMKLTPSNLVSASKITPALRLLYPEEATVEEDDENAEIAVDSEALDVPGLFAQKELL